MKSSQVFRVLIADDSNAMRSVLSSLFKSLGYEVVALLGDGVKVIGEVARLNVDIVCLDFHMPNRDGLDVLKELHEKQPEVAVIMITGDENPKIQEQATDLGAAGFIYKPFSQEQISNEMYKVSSALSAINALASANQNSNLKTSSHSAIIVDDSETMRRLLKFILEGIGISVCAEGINGEQAIALVEQCQPDLICMDIEMPVMNGLLALARINSIKPDLPVVMISGLADKQTVVEAIKKGAAGYILKPFDPDQISKEIKKVLPDLNSDDVALDFDPL